MPSLIMPPVSPNASGQPVSNTGPRGRGGEPEDGRGFGAALDRSRAATDKKTAETNAAVVDKLTGHKGLPGEDKSKKDETPTDLLNLAFLGNAQLPVDPALAAARAAAQGQADLGTAAEAGAATASAAAQAAAKSTAAQDPLAATLPDATADATDADAAKAPLTAEEAVKAAMARAAKDAAPSDAAADPDAAQATLPAGSARADTATQAATLTAALPPAVPAAAGAQAGATSAAGASTSRSNSRDAVPTTANAQQAKPSTPAETPDALKAAQASNTPDLGKQEPAPATAPLAATAVSQVTTGTTDRSAAPADRAPVLSVAPPVGSEEWGPAIGQQMLRMNASGHHVAELNLNPANLGPLKVTLSLGDNQAQAMFVSAHESVRKAVEAALPQLRTTLAEQGISLGQTSVGAEPRQFAGQGANDFTQQNQQKPSGGSDYPGSSRFEANAVAQAQPATRTAVLRNSGSGVDTFA
jgi:flagellar hook-length control protein FliK